MRVRWTTDAAEDLERICDYVARERPEAARRIALDVLRAIEGLRAVPSRGRPGRVQGTRKLVLTRPFLACTKFAKRKCRYRESCSERDSGLRRSLGASGSAREEEL
jgi:toxin ParE1/3/4